MRILILVLILMHGLAYADMDANSKEALQKTKDVLTNKSAREEAVKKDPRAADADAKAGALAGSEENKDKMYAIAAQVMEKIVAEANGNPEKMQQLLLEAQSNPQKFYQKYFTPAQKKQVQRLANKIQKDAPAAGPSK